MKWKYRIVQKGDLYAAQSKIGYGRNWFWHTYSWCSKEEACRFVDWMKRCDEQDNLPITHHKPEDICAKCKESE